MIIVYVTMLLLLWSLASEAVEKYHKFTQSRSITSGGVAEVLRIHVASRSGFYQTGHSD